MVKIKADRQEKKVWEDDKGAKREIRLAVWEVSKF